MSTKHLRHLALMGIVMVAVAILFVRPAYAASDSSDGWITSKVKLDLLTSEGISNAKNISVDTNGGVVALHGKVHTAEEKDKVESVARSVEGVVSVNDLINIVPEPKEKAITITDDRVWNTVTKNLMREKNLDRIHVTSVDNGVVQLSGETKTIDEELQAVRVAADTAGVKRVTTQIKTAKEKQEQAAEEEIAEEGKTSSASSSEHEGTEAMPQESPVRKLGRKISKTMSFSATDARITSQIKLRYMGDGRVPAHDINVDTTRGAVTLFGMVPTHEARQAAEKSAREVSGVHSVTNALQVVPKEEHKAVAAKDDDIEKGLEGKFKNMKDFEKVNVSAANGVVRLTGEVATLDEKTRAATMARSQHGVRAVEDELKVAEKAAKKEQK